MNQEDYKNSLIKMVMENSEADEWEEAVKEWAISEYNEDDSLSGKCICGREGLRHQFRIENLKNGNSLFPIGSSCIQKFGRDDLNKDAALEQQLYILYKAIKNGISIDIDSEFFSKRMLKYFYDSNIFEDNKYNKYDGYNDYEFLVKMFGAHEITENQRRKFRGLLYYTIKPFLYKKFDKK